MRGGLRRCSWRIRPQCWLHHPSHVVGPGRSAIKKQKPHRLCVLDGRNPFQEQTLVAKQLLPFGPHVIGVAERSPKDFEALLFGWQDLTSPPNLWTQFLDPRWSLASSVPHPRFAGMDPDTRVAPKLLLHNSVKKKCAVRSCNQVDLVKECVQRLAW